MFSVLAYLLELVHLHTVQRHYILHSDMIFRISDTRDIMANDSVNSSILHLFLISLSFYRAVFKVNDNNCWGLTASGKEFAGFKELFGKDERGFGYIRIQVRIVFQYFNKYDRLVRLK